MRKAILYSLFGVGAISGSIREELEAEGLLLVEEGLPGWLVERNVRLPGRRSAFRGQFCTGALAVSQERVYVQTGLVLQFAIPRGEPRMQELHVELCGKNRILLSFDYHLLRRCWHGSVSLRLKTPLASLFCEAFVAAGAQAGRIRF